MKANKLFKFLVLFACCIFTASCSKDDASEELIEELTDEYYVHYISSVYSTVSYKDQTGKMVSWSNNKIAVDVSVGPVRKGFEAKMQGHCGLTPLKNPTARIQVSKNGGPWIDKKIVNINDGNVSLSYTIDF